MRLRQAVLHPGLVLKRLSQNLAANKKLKGRTKAEKLADVEEEGIKLLIESYGGRVQSSSKAGEGTVDDTEEDPVDDCIICLEVSPDSRLWGRMLIRVILQALVAPVQMTKCDHKACRECIEAVLAQYEEQGDEVSLKPSSSNT